MRRPLQHGCRGTLLVERMIVGVAFVVRRVYAWVRVLVGRLLRLGGNGLDVR